jgi:hypothetical protein
MLARVVLARVLLERASERARGLAMACMSENHRELLRLLDTEL